MICDWAKSQKFSKLIFKSAASEKASCVRDREREREKEQERASCACHHCDRTQGEDNLLCHASSGPRQQLRTEGDWGGRANISGIIINQSIWRPQQRDEMSCSRPRSTTNLITLKRMLTSLPLFLSLPPSTLLLANNSILFTSIRCNAIILSALPESKGGGEWHE